MGFGEAFAFRVGGGYLPRARRAVGLRERRRARFRHRRARVARRRRVRRARAGAMAGARGDADSRHALLRRRAASSRRTARRASSRRNCPRSQAAAVGRISAAAQHRPHPRPVAHDDAHRPEPAARRASAGAVRRNASDDAAERWPASMAASPALRIAHGACVLKVVVSEGQQRGSLFAPIHWSDETASSAPHRRTGDAGDRSVLRPAGSEGDAGSGRAGRISLIAVSRWRARALTLPTDTWWARVALATATGCCSPPTMHRRLARARRRTVRRQRRARRICRRAARHLSRGGLRRRPARRRLFVGPADAAPQWDAVKAAVRSRKHGRGGNAAPCCRAIDRRLADPGPVVCACFGVGLNVIRAALGGWRRQQCRGDRQGAARRHQLRLLPAGTEKDRGRWTHRANRLKRGPLAWRALARLPVFFALDGKRVVLAGGSAGAAWKAELCRRPARASMSTPQTFPTRCGRWRPIRRAASSRLSSALGR